MANDTFPLKKDAYLAFDALSLKELVKQRLNEEGIVTDQVYEGSYLSTLIDIVCYTFNTLIYYVNRTSTESLFTEAQLYENINRIVKTIGYSPIGNQSSILSFSCSSDGNLENGLYTIPRFSYITLGSVAYSFNKDITFSKSLSGQTEYLNDFSQQNLLYQGRFVEYPLYTALGEDNELVYILPGDNISIDHFNINVFVKDSSGKWKEWKKTNALYLENSQELKYELRLNENYHYEIKFGNNINGKKLNPNDTIAIYYLKSEGKGGEVGENVLRSGKLVKFQTTQYNTIFNDLNADNLTPIDTSDLGSLIFDNNSSSTYFSESEDVESIRKNAPATFKAQYRLVTTKDHESYVKTNFANLIHDVKVVNNWSYLSEYLKYFYDIGIANPNNVSRVLFNQINFADSCNFNNIYLFIAPKLVSDSKNQMAYVSPALKQLIISSAQDIKTHSEEIIIMDPQYISFGIAISKSATPDLDDLNNSEIVIIQDSLSKRDPTSIQQDVCNIFKTYFSRNNLTLGQIIDITEITNKILAVNGVSTFYTRRIDDPSIKYQGLSMLIWNPIYNTDLKLITKNETLSFFKFPILNDYNVFEQYVKVENTVTLFETVEF